MPGRTGNGTLIVGAGLAGLRCATTLRSLGYTDPITIAGEERHGPYERPALSKSLLAGDKEPASLSISSVQKLKDLGIRLHVETVVDAIDPGGLAFVDDGRRLRWSTLVFATGARPRLLAGTERINHVTTLRTIEDALRLRERLIPGSRLTIIGCGFVGAEVAWTALQAGVTVTVLEAADTPFENTLGPDVGGLLLDRYRMAGVEVRTGARVSHIESDISGNATGVVLGDGSVVFADTVLVGIGAIPNDGLYCALAGSASGAGIAVDAAGATEIECVYACGDVAAVARNGAIHRRTEHWTAAASQAATVARAIMGVPSVTTGPSYVWSDQFGMRLQIVGDPGAADRIEIADADVESLLVRYLDASGRLIGGAASNRPQDTAQWRKALIAA